MNKLILTYMICVGAAAYAADQAKASENRIDPLYEWLAQIGDEEGPMVDVYLAENAHPQTRELAIRLAQSIAKHEGQKKMVKENQDPAQKEIRCDYLGAVGDFCTIL